MMVMTLPWHWLGLAGPVAARRQLQLCRSDHRRLGTVGHRLARRRPGAARLRAAVRAQSRRASPQSIARAAPAVLRAGGASAASRSCRAQRLRTLERACACSDGAGLWLSDRSVRDRSDRRRRWCIGCIRSRQWRSHPTLMFSIGPGESGQRSPSSASCWPASFWAWSSFPLSRDGATGSMPSPRFAERSEYCRDRRHGSRSPIARRRARCRRWFGHRACCKSSPMPNRSEDRPRRRRFALPVTATRACRWGRSFRTWPVNRARRSTSN